MALFISGKPRSISPLGPRSIFGRAQSMIDELDKADRPGRTGHAGAEKCTARHVPHVRRIVRFLSRPSAVFRQLSAMQRSLLTVGSPAYALKFSRRQETVYPIAHNAPRPSATRDDAAERACNPRRSMESHVPWKLLYEGSVTFSWFRRPLCDIVPFFKMKWKLMRRRNEKLCERTL